MRRQVVAAVLIPLALAACGNDGRDGADVPADAGSEGSGDVGGDAGAADAGVDTSTADAAGGEILNPTEALLVTVHWDTPGDPDQTDEGFAAGTDVDLHLLHPNGCWDDETWDCHFASRDPVWAGAGDEGGNPTMDLEDTDGAGPEIIRYDDPIDGLTYRVGVHHYENWDFGPSTAFVRIYIDGDVAWEGQRLLEQADTFWEVATVSWPGREVTAIDRVTAGTPGCE